MKNIVKGWQTTAIGLFMFLSAFAYVVLIKDISIVIFATLLVVGLLFLFAKDSVLKGLRALPDIMVSKFKKKDV